jgi:hypothetical protein
MCAAMNHCRRNRLNRPLCILPPSIKVGIASACRLAGGSASSGLRSSRGFPSSPMLCFWRRCFFGLSLLQLVCLYSCWSPTAGPTCRLQSVFFFAGHGPRTYTENSANSHHPVYQSLIHSPRSSSSGHAFHFPA